MLRAAEKMMRGNMDARAAIIEIHSWPRRVLLTEACHARQIVLPARQIDNRRIAAHSCGAMPSVTVLLLKSAAFSFAFRRIIFFAGLNPV